MSTIIDFILDTDVHLWISLLIALATVVYWALSKIFVWRDFDAVSLIAVVGIPAVMSFSLDSILNNYKTKGDIDFFIRQLEKYADCAYAVDKLGEIRKDLMKFKGKSVETFSEDETISELIRAIKNAETQVIYVDHYILSWESDLELLFQANLAAIEDRVEIKHIFILPEDILIDPEKMNLALGIMERHKNAGIDVRYIKQNDILGSDINYRYYALNNYCWIDNELIASLTPSSHRVIPIHSLIEWSDKSIETFNVVQDLLTSKYISAFSTTADYYQNSIDK